MRLLLIALVAVLTASTFYLAVQSLPSTADAQVSANTAAQTDISDAQRAADRAAFEEQTAALNGAITDLQAKMQEQATTLEATLAEREQLKTDLEETNQRLSVVAAENAALASDKAALVDQIAAFNADALDQQSTTDDVQATIQELQTQLNAALENEQVLLTTIAELEQERADLTGRLADLETSATEAQAVSAPQTAELEALLEQRAAALQAAEERIAMLTEVATAQAQSTADMTNEIAEFEQVVATMTAETSQMADDIAKRDSVIAGLMSQAGAPAVSRVADCQQRSDAVLAGTKIGFDAGTTTLTPESTQLLETLADIAVDCTQDDLTLEIEGHTDSVGGAASNLLLSDGRAKAVRDFLQGRGVPAQSIRAVGFGGSEPIADNNTTDSQSQNQRIVFDWEQG